MCEIGGNVEKLAEFSASIPQIQSAFNIGGDRSARLKLDVDASEVAEVVKLIGGTERLLRIVVYVEE